MTKLKSNRFTQSSTGLVLRCRHCRMPSPCATHPLYVGSPLMSPIAEDPPLCRVCGLHVCGCFRYAAAPISAGAQCGGKVAAVRATEFSGQRYITPTPSAVPQGKAAEPATMPAGWVSRRMDSRLAWFVRADARAAVFGLDGQQWSPACPSEQSRTGFDSSVWGKHGAFATAAEAARYADEMLSKEDARAEFTKLNAKWTAFGDTDAQVNAQLAKQDAGKAQKLCGAGWAHCEHVGDAHVRPSDPDDLGDRWWASTGTDAVFTGTREQCRRWAEERLNAHLLLHPRNDRGEICTTCNGTVAKHYETLLDGRPFLVRCDHDPASPRRWSNVK